MKKIIISLSLILFVLFGLVNIVSYNQNKVSVQLFGIENELFDANIIYKGNNYVCNIDNPQSTYLNGDEISIVCENRLLPIVKHSFKYGIDSLLSTNLDDDEILLSQWKQRGYKNIIAIFKAVGNEKDNWNKYYTITVESNNQGKGYLDESILFDSKNNRYIQIKDKEVFSNIETGLVVSMQDPYSTVALYLDGKGEYEKIYVNIDYYNRMY